jgi:hypothetical protein
MENKKIKDLETSSNISKEEKMILYEDKYIVITNEFITIKAYYFPFAISKTIPFSKIKRIDISEINSLTGKLKIWGMNYKMFWFHFDATRMFKNQCIVLDTGACIKPAITPDNMIQVFGILNDKIIKN